MAKASTIFYLYRSQLEQSEHLHGTSSKPALPVAAEIARSSAILLLVFLLRHIWPYAQIRQVSDMHVPFYWIGWLIDRPVPSLLDAVVVHAA